MVFEGLLMSIVVHGKGDGSEDIDEDNCDENEDRGDGPLRKVQKFSPESRVRAVCNVWTSSVCTYSTLLN